MKSFQNRNKPHRFSLFFRFSELNVHLTKNARYKIKDRMLLFRAEAKESIVCGLLRLVPWRARPYRETRPCSFIAHPQCEQIARLRPSIRSSPVPFPRHLLSAPVVLSRVPDFSFMFAAGRLAQMRAGSPAVLIAWLWKKGQTCKFYEGRLVVLAKHAQDFWETRRVAWNRFLG